MICKKTPEEWLKESEYKGILILENWALDYESFYTKHEFEQKLLTSRVQISQDRLKELLKK
jgi:hypothetical protein